jgi:hypothetical protein
MLAEITFAFVGSLTVAPAAHAQIEPRKAVAHRHKRLSFVMSAGVYAAAGLDMQETASFRHRFHEYGPLAKPLVGLSTPAALFATGVNWLGWKMARSPHWHKIWWVPHGHLDRRKCGPILLNPRAQDNELARSPHCSTVQ